MKEIIRAFVSTLVLSAAASASATPVTVSTADGQQFRSGAYNQGWWGESGWFNNNPTNDNHSTGYTGFHDQQLRSFYTFDLSNISGKITSATLRVMRGEQPKSVDLSLWDVSTPADIVNNTYVLTDGSINADLGSGNSYGSYKVEIGQASDYLSLNLNSYAINDLNSAQGFFTIGARVDGLSGQLIFFNRHHDITYLDLEVSDDHGEVPEPSSIALIVAALAGLRFSRPRKS